MARRSSACFSNDTMAQQIRKPICILQVRVLQEENAAIMRMVAALQPHKFSFTLEPAENLTSLAEGFCSGEADPHICGPFKR